MAVGALGSFLMAMAGPLAARVLVSLGIGWITYEGVVYVAQQIQTQVQGLWAQLPSSFLGLSGLCGLTEAVGLVLGGIVARASLYAAARLGLLPGITPP